MCMNQFYLFLFFFCEIFRPFAAVLGIASALFCSYGVAEYLQDAANGMIAANMIGMIMFAKLLIALEVLAPVSLYLAIIMAFGKLYDGSELYVTPALRISPAAVLKPVMIAACGMGIVVAILSNIVRPWSYDELDKLKDRAASGMDVGALIPGNFYTLDGDKRTVYLEDKTILGEEARGVYIFEALGKNRLRIIASRKSVSVINEDKEDKKAHGDWLQFQDAHMYEIGIFPHVSDRIMQMRRGNRASLQETPEEEAKGELPYYMIDSTWSLMTHPNGERRRIVEAQWRCSTFVTTILLALLAAPLSRGGGPRRSKSGRLGIAIVIYFIYYMSYMTMRNWMQSGKIAIFPGIWWAPIGLETALFVPHKLIEITPMAALLGCLIGLGGLARHQELTALTGTGVSDWRIVQVASLLAIPFSLALIIISQTVVPSAFHYSQAIEAKASADRTKTGHFFWALGKGGVFLKVGSIADDGRAWGIQRFKIGSDGKLEEFIKAQSSIPNPDGSWHMSHLLKKTIVRDRVTEENLDSLDWKPFLSREEMYYLTFPIAFVSPTALLQHIIDGRLRGEPALLCERELLNRLALPFSIVALIFFAAPFLFGSTRSKTVGSRIGIGVMIAVAYTLFQEILDRAGLVTGISPIISAFLPPLFIVAAAVQLYARSNPH
ncbi:permease [Lasius niger]|uniref:Permease n=1 Tax=Lasius niger TaxID=67767 RepID=A0A0J7KC07_LASNI|nr:permease [Lasius niger]